MAQLRSVTCHMGSHSVTCHPTQANTPRLNPSHAGRYSIYLPRRDGRLSWPSWFDSAPAGSWTWDLSITSPTLNQCNHQDKVVVIPELLCSYWSSRHITERYGAWRTNRRLSNNSQFSVSSFISFKVKYIVYRNRYDRFPCYSTAFLSVFVCRLPWIICQKVIGPKYRKQPVRSHI